MFTSRQLRKKYIDFFATHGHAEVESSSTVPHKDDQTVLFTTAGMQQFVPNLMGKPHPKGTRLSSVQKCVRTVDIDEVGDNRHLTLFEMLGNWSLGDYFKKEALTWSWEFLTKEACIAPERIWVTVFGGDKDIPLDTDAEKIWLDLGVPKERIVPIGPDPKNPKKGRGDNFWGPAGPTGPCGPCSEMHIWIGEGQPKLGQNPANDDTNFVEVWNDVFMEFMLDKRVILLDGMYCLFNEQFEVDTGVMNAIKALDTRVIIITNAPKEKMKPIIDVTGFECVTYENNPTKTSSEYFSKMLAEKGLVASGCIYLDHLQDNLESAAKVGIEGVLFTNLSDIQKVSSSLMGLSKMAKQNVDTGMGLERLTMILNNKKTVFETDVYAEILAKIEDISKKQYPPYHGDEDEKNAITRAFRVIADHIRTATHIIADGIAPSNEGRGYVLRRLIRRAVRYGAKLGITETFLSKVASSYIDAYSCFYPEISSRSQVVFSTLTLEEEQFLKTLERGEKKLEEIQNEKFKMKNSKFSGADAFLLSDTYGFPKDLTRELAQEKGFEIDEEIFDAEFEEELKAQRERSRANKNFDRKGAENAVFEGVSATEFVGYEMLESEAKILKIVDDGEQKYRIVFDKTPFYAESGGQVGDRGEFKIQNEKFKITDVKKLENGVFVHYVQTMNNEQIIMNNEELAILSVDKTLRARTARHHSAAHLLQGALMQVLGSHIEQAGSLVDENRTRFDFSHPKALSTKEILEVQKVIAQWVLQSHPVTVKTMPIADAKAQGAVALFSEKYGDTVRTIKMGDVSFELCGGTHVSNTSEIGAVQIISETSVASGIRRIEMVVGASAQELLDKTYLHEEEIANRLKCTPVQILERLEKLFAEKKEQEDMIRTLEKTIAENQAQTLFAKAQNGVLEEMIAESQLPKVVNIAKALIAQGLVKVVLITEDGGIVVATVKDGEDAREVFKSIQAVRGGNGGGSPTLVQGKGVIMNK